MSLLQRLFGPNVTKLTDNGDVDGLRAVVTSEAGTDLRVAAVSALASFDDEHARDALVSTLDDPDHEVAAAAEAALRELGEASVQALVGALGGEAGARALAMIVDLGETAVEPLREACASSPDEPVRALALDGLMKLDRSPGTPEVRETVFRVLLASLGDRSPSLRATAASALGERRDSRAARALAAQLKDGDETVRDACRQALAAIGPEVVLHAVDALADRNPNARCLAAGLIGEMCTEDIDTATRTEVLKGLLSRVGDGAPEIREAVAGSMKRVRAADVVTEQLAHLGDPEWSDHDEVLDFLKDLLEHAALEPGQRDAAVRDIASLGFGDIGTSRSDDRMSSKT